ncbi:MFS transporter [Kribbella pittospori]|uniref:MFS transporter n=1 Tax=Kribbella pittospori TaxID=722689 RepID=UPI001EE11DB1|nr:MFS transporter [Kribbella pittospori]
MPLSFRAPTLWADRDFLRLWLGQSASQFGAFASQVTLPLVAVTSLGASAAHLGALRAVQQVPILLISLFVGVLVDRRRFRTVMVYADLGRALALAAVPLGWMLGMPFLYVVAFAVGVFTVCFDVALQASFPRLVERDQLAQGNSMLETTRSAAQICGPALGGGLASLLTAPIAVLAGAAFFAVSSLSIGRIRRLTSTPSSATSGLGRQIREGLRIVIRGGSLRAVAIATCIYQFSFTALTTVYLLFLARTLELPSAVVGLVLAAFGPGVLIGSLLSGWLPRWFGYGRVVVFAALISDVVMLCTSGLHGSGPATVAALIAINVLYGVFSQTVDVAVTAIRQAITPLAIQGRVVATINFLGMGLTPLGALLGGAVAGAFGIRIALLLATAGMFLSPLALSLSPLARLGTSLAR